MKNAGFTDDGEMRCWKCGSQSFKMKRTGRSKLGMGVGALMTKKKAKCLKCGKYNDVA